MAQPPLTFIFRIDALYPKSIQYSHGSGKHCWEPPGQWNAYNYADGSFYRWSAGTVTLVPKAQLPHFTSENGFHTYSNSPHLYRTATIFNQHDTCRFVAVEFDARTDNVETYPPGWQQIGFRYDNSHGGRKYSHLHVAGDRRHLVAPGNPAWNDQLFTQPYHYSLHHSPNPPPASAGVTGTLPLLLSLAAFSRPERNLHQTLTNNLRQGMWLPHPNGYDHGRKFVSIGSSDVI